MKGTLINSSKPWERLSIDFVGPMCPSNGFKYLLTVVDEYSRYPFAFPCKEISTAVVINCLLELFSLFGCPNSIHSDRGLQFESTEFRTFLLQNGIIKTRSTPYHPQGNGQCERINGNLCKTISFCLRSNNLGKDQWIRALPQALASMRSLLCTATSTTPHDRMFLFPRNSKFGTRLPSFFIKNVQLFYTATIFIIKEIQLSIG